MTEAAAMQHLRRVRAHKEQAAGQAQYRVVMTARDYSWWETNYERLMSPQVRESRYVPGRQEPAPPAPTCKAFVHGLPGGYQRNGEPSEAEALPVVPGQVQSFLHKETDTATEGSPGVFETKSAQVMRLWNGHQ